MAETDDKRAYSRGYWRGSQRAWPDHRPLVPPHGIVGPIVKAAQELRDVADHICAIIDKEDDFAKALAPKIDAFDEAMTKYGEWLRKNQ